jgi:hypothetical protein
MKRTALLVGLALAGVGLLVQPALGQRADIGSGQRIQSGGINWAPVPGDYTVVSVDAYHRIVTLAGPAGNATEVHVPGYVYDLDELAAGDRIRVDFFADRNDDQEMTAATIWPRPWSAVR